MSKILNSKRVERNDMKRKLSLHVGTRWYRAPEICLVENHYDQAADLWGVGCLIYELLNYYHSNKKPQN